MKESFECDACQELNKKGKCVTKSKYKFDEDEEEYRDQGGECVMGPVCDPELEEYVEFQGEYKCVNSSKWKNPEVYDRKTVFNNSR